MWMGLVFFSCSDGGTRGKEVAGNDADTAGKTVAGIKADTAGKSRSAAGNTVNSQQTNTVNPGRDTALRYKTEIRNNGPDQSRVDSIKNAKTKKKK